MKTFFSNIWKYLALLAFGAIAGIIAGIKLIGKPSVSIINAENYIAEQFQKVGKLKQRGEGNSQQIDLEPVNRGISSGRQKRISKRKARREVRFDTITEKEEMEQKDF